MPGGGVAVQFLVYCISAGLVSLPLAVAGFARRAVMNNMVWTSYRYLRAARRSFGDYSSH
jgi:hypothetical protein